MNGRSRVVVCALVAVLTGLTAMSAPPVELVVWHSYRGGEAAAFEKVVAQYNAAKAAAGVKVTTLPVPYDAFADKITAAVPRGKGPDIFIYAQDRLGGWVEAGKTIEPIDFYVDKATLGRFLPTTVQAMTYHGTLYALPFNYKVITMVYNKKLLTKVPKTTGELVTIAKSLTDASTGRFGVAYWYNNFYYHAILMNAFGGGAFDAAGKPIMNCQGNVKSLDLLMKWVDKDKFLPAEPSTALVTSLFNDGKAAIVFSGPWFLGEIAKGIDYGLAVMPTVDEAGGKPMSPWMTVEGVYIAAGSKNKDAAYDFVKYVTDVEATKVMAVEGRQTPANTQVYADPQVGNDPILKVFRQQVEVAVPMPNLAEMSMMWTPATSAMSSIVQKSSAPKAALDQAQKEVEQAIALLRKGK
ncbi:MAG TPA: extracellular solute-binding protein [Thermoanaerobaculaceae bacterium]|nr:extracellular solute-binding protein [Thermoanaerobaculaceae bacterium]